MMELREKKEALRKEFSQIDNDCFEVYNDWGSTDPTWSYTHWLENKLLSINTPKHETVEKWEERTGEIYKDDAPVWAWIQGDCHHSDRWVMDEYQWGKINVDFPEDQIIVANHHGKPELTDE